MGVFSWFKPKVRRFLSLLRDGALEFGAENIDRGLEIAVDTIKNTPYNSTKEFADILLARLTMEYRKAPGGFVDLLKNAVIQALKKQGRL